MTLAFTIARASTSPVCFRLLSSDLSLHLWGSLEHLLQGWSSGPDASTFVYLGMSWFPIYFWGTVLLDTGCLVDSSFSFSTLTVLAHCLLAPRGSDKKPADTPTEDLSCAILLLSRAAFQILCLCFCWKFDYNVSRCGCLRVHCIWISLDLLDVYMRVFHQIWGVFSHYFFRYSLYHFSLFWDSHDVCVGLLAGVLQVP